MSLWNRIIGAISGSENNGYAVEEGSYDASRYAFVDVEVGMVDEKIHDIGAVRCDGAIFHSAKKSDLLHFLKDCDFICGHNIVHHDAKYLFGSEGHRAMLVDTLYISPLLFPERPYHHLLKNDKLVSEQMNNPVNDCQKAQHLLKDEMAKWEQLPISLKQIYASLLKEKVEFKGFMLMNRSETCSQEELITLILEHFKEKICQHVDLAALIASSPVALAYALALVTTTEHYSITPPWVLYHYPEVENVLHLLRHIPCAAGCAYCNPMFDIRRNLHYFFGYKEFRTYEGEPLQENAVSAAVDGKSLLAIFPTGGGKSLTFQLPALMEARSVHGLTVVISPLQSLMKDQVDNLVEKGITDAVTINGLLDPISRSLAIERVQNGEAALLYISPEMLRSKTIEKILMARNVVRFVIDEAHCFSSWGQDFRVDYLYIGKFIRCYQERKRLTRPIPVSCFTATAKQKVVQDICDYFKQMLDLNMQVFASSAARTNLRYSVIHAETDDDKYAKLRSLVSGVDCPTIVYVSRTKRTKQLAERLSKDGYQALPFNGQMDADEKVHNQEEFMNDRVRIMVATSAFGMGVDKSDVGLVVHYDISDSLENYVQEAGRAGRDPHLEAKCFVLYSDNDLDKHFILLNQTKLSISEIQQVWKAIKEMTKQRARTNCSALEIARAAGWDDSVSDIETRVRTALSALEQAGYIERGNNVPHVYATGITVRNMDEARKRITESLLFSEEERKNAVRIIKSLIVQRSIAKAQSDEAESRIDYLADILGLKKSEVVSAVERMRQEGVLADSKDMLVYLNDPGESENRSRKLLDRFTKLEQYILNSIPDEALRISCKQLNENAQRNGIATATEKDIRTILYFLTIKGYTLKREDVAHNMVVKRKSDMASTQARFERRRRICEKTIAWLYVEAERNRTESPERGEQTTQRAVTEKSGVSFSVIQLLNHINSAFADLFDTSSRVKLEEVEEALLYLSKIGALKIEGGFLVLYNAMEIRRLKDNRLQYKKDDYRMLSEFYRQKIQQVHIVGEYANLMVRDYNAALQYVQDYFQMDYKLFINKYFKGERKTDIDRNLTPEKYQQLFGTLSDRQMEVISDDASRVIVVAAGPGSGKTRVLVHKLASLLLLEDVKHEQLLMLTFSRAAAIEFKQRLLSLIGSAAHFVEIKTFHSYCFDLLGRIGNLEDVDNVVAQAARMIQAGEVEPSRIAKTVLVIDEAQDMSQDEYHLVCALMAAHEEMRLIAVGDDDQNIYEFRGSNSKYMASILSESHGRLIQMTENYRSSKRVVDFANTFVKRLRHRMKAAPILSMSANEGCVTLTHHTSDCMYEPLVRQLMAHRGQGTTCVLTQKNEEAVILVALLRRYGLQSKLIQGMDGFAFINMAEVRMFLKIIKEQTATPFISSEVWEAAKNKTYDLYASSEALPYLQRCLQLFEETNKERYLTDLTEFILESSVEDFCDLSGAEVVVSTIHKSKGREFDDVYILLSSLPYYSDEVLRCYYVGFTRAKQRLFIHTNASLFDNMQVDRLYRDNNHYQMPDEIMLQLTHKDVNLNFFKPHKQEIMKLRAGNKLRFVNNYFYAQNSQQPIALLSQKMQTELLRWTKNGYAVIATTIRFIVAWKAKDAPQEEKEHAVLLLNMELKKISNPS